MFRCASTVTRRIRRGHRWPMESSSASIVRPDIVAWAFISRSFVRPIWTQRGDGSNCGRFRKALPSPLRTVSALFQSNASRWKWQCRTCLDIWPKERQTDCLGSVLSSARLSNERYPAEVQQSSGATLSGKTSSTRFEGDETIRI